MIIKDNYTIRNWNVFVYHRIYHYNFIRLVYDLNNLGKTTFRTKSFRTKKGFLTTFLL